MNERELTGYPSIDKPWQQYYSEAALRAPLPECTVWENIYERNKAHPGDTALLYFGKKISYGKLFSEVDRTTRALAHLGVKNGDNAALCMPAVPEAIYTILALNKLGANAGMLNPTFSEAQLTDRINEMEADVLLAVNELYPVVQNVIPKTAVKHVVTCPAVNSLGAFARLAKKAKPIPRTISWNTFIRQGQGTAYETAPYEKQKPAIMVFSSGTTGASKGIQLTNDGINATICEYENGGFGFKRQDIYFAQIPIWFSTGISVTMLTPLAFGIVVMLEPIYDFEIFRRHILKYKPNFLVTAMGLLDYLMNKQPRAEAYKHFMYLCAGGEYVAPVAEEKYNKWLADNGNLRGLHKGYGMCECGGTVTYSCEKINTVGSAGIPMPHVTVAAFDLDTGAEKRYGERGELRVLTPCRMLGYYKKPSETAKYFRTDAHGNVWACTGDMGYVAEDGNVYVSGRISDSYINSSGRTVYLFDIERAVLDIPQVRQCKALAHELDGAVTHVCHTVLVDGADQEQVLRLIKEHCAEKLDADSQPLLLRLYSDALPVAPSGKLNISEMKANTDSLLRL